MRTGAGASPMPSASAASLDRRIAGPAPAGATKSATMTSASVAGLTHQPALRPLQADDAAQSPALPSGPSRTAGPLAGKDAG